MRVLVTGGLGYLGGRISQHLVACGHEVFVSSRSQHKELPHWLKDRGHIITLDLESNASRIPSVDALVHLAAMNEIDCASSPRTAMEVNTLGTMRLIEAINDKNLERFIYFSTAHVYAAPLVGTFSEAHSTRPIHPYAYSHRAAEDLVFAFAGKAFQKGIVVRLSNGFGCPERASVNRWTLLVNDLCRQIATSGKIVLQSDGTQSRDFITLTDTARGVEHLLSLPLGDLKDGLFNLGSGKAMSVYEMAVLVQDVAEHVLSRKLPAIERPAPKADAVSPPLYYNCDKLFSTGFKLQEPLRDEIAATLQLCLKSFPITSVRP